MKNTKTKTEITKTEETEVFQVGANIRFFRKKKGTNQTDFAAFLIQAYQDLDRNKLSTEYKKEYDQLNNREITQQLVSDWETGEAETPKLIAYLAAQHFNLGVEWLTDHVFDVFEGAGFVQTGGNSYNNWHTVHKIEVNNDPEPIVDSFKSLMQIQKEYYEDLLKKENK